MLFHVSPYYVWLQNNLYQLFRIEWKYVSVVSEKLRILVFNHDKKYELGKHAIDLSDSVNYEIVTIKTWRFDRFVPEIIVLHNCNTECRYISNTNLLCAARIPLNFTNKRVMPLTNEAWNSIKSIVYLIFNIITSILNHSKIIDNILSWISQIPNGIS